MKHINVALFVPHEGCPHQCAFCNQRSISGSAKRLSADDVDEAAQTAVLSGASPENSEIAFFGGSFTAIERGYMEELLGAAAKQVERGFFRGIRISTRPDCVDGEILKLLKRYHVTAIELGAQSMDDRVLAMNKRGHSSQDTLNAVRLIKACGIECGLQMMTGLYGCDGSAAAMTARKFVELTPATVRIYPTLVLKDTPLEELYKRGEYVPQELACAVKQCAELMLMFHEAQIKVIRVGLHSGGGLDGGYIAGAYHPAFRELCEAEIYYSLAEKEMEHKSITGEAVLFVKPSERSKMAGQHRKNLERFKKKAIQCRIVTDESLNKYEIRIEQTEQREFFR